MSEKRVNDQASHLRDIMEQIDDQSKVATDERDVMEDTQRSVDVLELPPRSHVHADKNTGTKWRISFPLVRLLFVLFLLIVVLVLTYQIWGKDWQMESQASQAGKSIPAGEQVFVHQGSMEESSLHVVKKGETIKSIAKQYYGDNFRNGELLILKANNLDDSLPLSEGQKIIIPNN